MPSLSNWQDRNHETQQIIDIVHLCKETKSVQNRKNILEAALRTIIALGSRRESEQGYEGFVFPADYLQYYPINLNSFSKYNKDIWPKLSLNEWINWLCRYWGIETHFKVALRKLRGQSQSTFQLRPSDRGLEVIGTPAAAFTSPRYAQALRILKDIGALQEENGAWVSSERGKLLRDISDEE